MKILIFVDDVGITAPGIVFDKIIYGLSKFHDIVLITKEFESKFDLKEVQIVEFPGKKLQYYYFKSVYGIFAFHPTDLVWSKRILNKIKNYGLHSFDIVISQVSNHHYSSIVAGKIAAKKYNLKHVIHSVDAIPAPGWPENKLYLLGVKKFLKNKFKKIDALFSSNESMLNYQLTTFNPDKEIVSGVIYNPSEYNQKVLSDSPKKCNNFVFAGKIYGKRKSLFLLAAFDKLLDEYPNSQLIFLGTWKSSKTFPDFSKRTVDKIKILPFQTDITVYYEEATALIDIDADVKEDVFLSSKMVDYLPINRIIISETGINSPSRKLFKGINSIIQCNHDSDEMYLAMKKAIETKNTMNFSDRNEVRDLFFLDNVIVNFNRLLEKLLKT